MEGQVSEGQLLGHHLPLAAGEGPDPGQQLGGVKGLGHVVVRPTVQALHFVGDLVTGGEHEDGSGHVGGAEAAGHLQPVQLGQHHIQDDDIVLGGERIIQAVGTVVDLVHLIFLLCHDLGQGLRQPDLVLHDQDTHNGPPFPIGLCFFSLYHKKLKMP